MQLKSLGLAIAACGMVGVGSAQAVTAQFDFGAGNVLPGWTEVGATLTGTNGTVAVTATAVGTAGGILMRDRGTGNGGGAEQLMWRDFFFASNGPGLNEGMDLTITGLTPGATYPIKLWGFDDTSNGGRGAIWNGKSLSFGDNPDASTLEDYHVNLVVTADALGTAVLQGRTHPGGPPANTNNVFVNGLQIGDAFVPEIVTYNSNIKIDIDTTDGTTPILTEAGYTSLDATAGNGANVTVDGVTFTVFSADGSRNRQQGNLGIPNALAGDFIFDDGAGQAVGLLVNGLPDGLYEVLVYAWDTGIITSATILDIGPLIVGITNFTSGPEMIFTDSFIPSPTDPFIFRFHTGDLALRDGFGIFTRENNDQNRARLNALEIRLAPIPEPATALLGVIGLAGLAMRRRREA